MTAKDKECVEVEHVRELEDLAKIVCERWGKILTNLRDRMLPPPLADVDQSMSTQIPLKTTHGVNKSG